MDLSLRRRQKKNLKIVGIDARDTTMVATRDSEKSFHPGTFLSSSLLETSSTQQKTPSAKALMHQFDSFVIAGHHG
jgi:hypothetical protein